MHTQKAGQAFFESPHPWTSGEPKIQHRLHGIDELLLVVYTPTIIDARLPRDKRIGDVLRSVISHHEFENLLTESIGLMKYAWVILLLFLNLHKILLQIFQIRFIQKAKHLNQYC